MLSQQNLVKILKGILRCENLDSSKKYFLKSALDTQSKNISPDTIISSNTLRIVLGLLALSDITEEDGYFSQITEEKNVDISIIFYLLDRDQISCLHRLEITEEWEWLGGSAISIFTFSELNAKEIILNADNRFLTIEKGILFGAKNLDNNSYSLVTCTCKPSFKVENYKSPTRDELEELKNKYPEYSSDLDKLTPKSSKANQNPMLSNHQFFDPLKNQTSSGSNINNSLRI